MDQGEGTNIRASVARPSARCLKCYFIRDYLIEFSSSR